MISFGIFFVRGFELTAFDFSTTNPPISEVVNDSSLEVHLKHATNNLPFSNHFVAHRCLTVGRNETFFERPSFEILGLKNLSREG